jgi:DNA polymerase theta
VIENLIFSAPTSAGKSLVADLLFLRPLLLNKANQELQVVESSEKPVSIFIVPYLSLITEKENKIKSLLKDLNLTAASIHSHKRAILSETEPPDVVFCTIQKANQLVNYLIEVNQIARLRTVVIDELHLIGDDQRGYILELLLTKLVYMKRDTPSLLL